MSARPRNALGRGLGALLPSTPTQGSEQPATRPSRTRGAAHRSEGASSSEPAGTPRPDAQGPYLEILIDLIDANPDQPRRKFDEENLQTLAASIRRDGVIQPVVVQRAGDRYELVVGERRWRAARAAGLERIPALVADLAPQARLEVAIVENVQRQDLNPIELAHAYRALANVGATQEEIGRKVSLDRSSIANHLRLLDLSRDIQEDVEEGRITMGHAKALLQVTHPERRRHLRDRILDQSLSVRASEELARETAGPSRRTRPARKREQSPDPGVSQLVETMRDRLQTQVRVQGTPDRGRIEIEYFGPEDLERIGHLILDGG